MTGADDRTSLNDLRELSLQYPFVEWALLYGAKPGTPRNPTAAWREAFFSAALPCSSAVHLCGAEAFVELREGRLPPDVLCAARLQLNINARRPDFSLAEVLDIYTRALDLGPDIILQHHDGTRQEIDIFLQGLTSHQRRRVHVLLDESRGKGLRPQSWAMPSYLGGVFIGYAGGIGPENAADVLEEVALASSRPCWIDMESGVRTDNQFDIGKAALVLAAAREHR